MVNLNEIKKEKTIQELLEFSILNIDKPSGPTSFDVVEHVGKVLGVKKTSHFGTLDPKVTGVLPIAINKACRLAPWFMKKNKTYIGIMRIHKEVDEESLQREMNKFFGKIKQLPPVKSRVKRAIREREIYKFRILEKEGKNVLFIAEVEAGTYIRKLIHDLGEEIGGAHMTELRRIQAGIFSESDKNFVNLYELDEIINEFKKGDEKRLREILIPGEIVSKTMQDIQVKDKFIKRLQDGTLLTKDFLEEGEEQKIKGKSISVFSGNNFIGVYSVLGEKGIIAKPEFILKTIAKI